MMKKHAFTLLALCSVLFAATALAQSAAPAKPGILVNADPTKPPPFVELPGNARSTAPTDPATDAIDPAVRARVTAAARNWAQSNGREFSPSLAFLHGVPTVMIMARAGETAEVRSRRLDAIVSACEFMLDDASFDRAVICVATYDPKATPAMSTVNVTVTRDPFQIAAKKYGKSIVVGDAMAALHANPASVQQLCSELGLN